MFTTRGLRRPAVALISGLLFASACGGSSSPKATAASANTDGQTSQSTSSSTSGSDSDTSSSSSGGTSAATKILDANYQSGSAHVEMSGGASKTADLTKAGGYTISGATVVTFTDEPSQQALSVTSSNDSGEPGGISLTLGGIATAGEFGRNCQLTVTKNEAAEFAGKVQCTDLDAIEGGTVYNHVTVTATFSAKA